MDKNKQLPLIEATTSWFHVFKSMIDSGDVAKMNHSTVVVYLVIKSYAGFNTGKSFPEIPLIAEKSGLSERQVKRCLNELTEFGYLSTDKKSGRKNKYTLREKVSLFSTEGEAAIASWDYVPSQVQAAQSELKRFMTTLDTKDTKIIQIENLTLNFFNQTVEEGATGTQNNTPFTVSNVKDKNLRSIFERIEQAREKDSKNK